MKPLFCRRGNKTSIRQAIIPMIPKHKTYVEPFFGAGAIYFYKPPSEKEVVNDLDKELMKDYALVKKVSTDSTKYPKDLNNLQSIKRFFNKPNKTNEEKLSLSIIKRCNGFGGNYATTTQQIYQPTNPIKKLKHIGKYKERMKNTKLYNTDYRNIIKKYDNKNTFFYLDPPYENSKGLYKNYDMDFEEMAKILGTIKGAFILSINDSKYIRTVFKNFKMKMINIRTSGVIGNKMKSKENVRKELLIYN